MKVDNVLVLLLFLLISCSETRTSSKRLFGTNEILTLDIDDYTPNASLGFIAHEDLLFNLVWERNELQIYDVEQKKLVKRLKYDIEGDKGVGQIFGYHVHNLDSIFLFGQVSPIVYLTDTSGIFKDSFQYEIPEGYTSAFIHPHYFVSPPVIEGDEMIVKTHINGSYREFTNDVLSSKHLVYAINLNTRKVRLMEHMYPADYLIGGLKQFESSMAFGKDKVVYSFFGDHRLFFASTFDDKLIAIEAASQYLDRRLKLFPLSGNRLETMQYINASSRYDNLIHDSFRNLYYRFAYPSIDLTDIDDILRLRVAPGPFIIMVLDEELNVLGETYFEAGKYLPSNFFVHKDGLYISTNHPDNPENEEDKFKFELLEIRNELPN
ncbi:DUF4221 family protein [Belliella kenyensis]|uniref:DUF4221 family protein n=1 Tax=Belliella kenyensis TaxID=1472724 RepID=A0ABV8EP93_9BACT|nr:DUF4221 family protein [Belliella kenyensis]MCH7400544.1 DUF4221 domain-containing protein [Belliella kenyensis]MDN3602169.1 DUF4221 family protein [Belliella kenyensis]